MSAKLIPEQKRAGTEARAVSAELRRLGVPHSPAQYDDAGTCLTCGERREHCPGVHTFEEIQEAARAQRPGKYPESVESSDEKEPTNVQE